MKVLFDRAAKIALAVFIVGLLAVGGVAAWLVLRAILCLCASFIR